MAKIDLIGWDATASNNTELNSLSTDGDVETPAGVDDWQRELMAQVARYNRDLVGLGQTIGGTANAITLTINQPWAALSDGMILGFKNTVGPNTGAATITVTNSAAVSLGSKKIRGQGDTALVGSEMLDDGVYLLRYVASYDSAAGAFVLLNPSPIAVAYIKLVDTKAAGTDGGTFTSGAWQTRTLNSEQADTGNNCSLSSSQMTLLAGTYRINASATALGVDRHQAKLYNTTDATDTIIGTSENTLAASGVTTRSFVSGEFAIATTKTFEIRHRCATTKATNGFGNAANFGVAEIFTTVELWKVA